MRRILQRGGLNVAIGMLLLLAAGTCGSGDNDNSGTSENNPKTDDGAEARAVILETPGGGISHITVTGSNADFGRYLALGEVTLAPGTEEGVRLEGAGVAVVQAQNDDQIVADVTCKVTDHGLDFTFHWRDSVTFSTGSTVSNTGAFVNNRPPGLFLSSIQGRKFNDNTLICYSCIFSSCGDTSCTARCGTCCLPLSEPAPPPCFFRR